MGVFDSIAFNIGLRVLARENPVAAIAVAELRREIKILQFAKRAYEFQLLAHYWALWEAAEFLGSIHFKVHGAEQTAKAFGLCRRDIRREINKAIKEAAAPIRADAASLAERFGPRTAGGYRISSTVNGVSIYQSLRKTTGVHPDFGGLQVTSVLEPAVSVNERAVVRAIDAAVGRVAASHGF